MTVKYSRMRMKKSMVGAPSAMEQLQLALESRALELAYERTCHQVELVGDAERVRKLRVRTIILEEKQDYLNAQVTQDDDRIDGLERLNERFQKDLEVCTGNLESTQGQLRLKLREIETLKVPANTSITHPSWTS